MRLLTFSFLKSCKLRALVNGCGTSRRFLVRDGARVAAPPQDDSLLEISPEWGEDEEPELRKSLLRDMRVLPNFITVQEEQALLQEVEPVLKRMRYEFDHWDNAIEGYRETERSAWSGPSAGVLARVREAAFSARGAGQPLERAHVLDLAAAGHIRPHVDAHRFCGEVIAGVCLLSSCVMRVQHSEPSRAHLRADALLPARALYVLRGVARHQFTHAVLGGEHSRWRDQPLPRQRRVAVIMRSKPAHTQ